MADRRMGDAPLPFLLQQSGPSFPNNSSTSSEVEEAQLRLSMSTSAVANSTSRVHPPMNPSNNNSSSGGPTREQLTPSPPPLRAGQRGWSDGLQQPHTPNSSSAGNTYANATVEENDVPLLAPLPHRPHHSHASLSTSALLAGRATIMIAADASASIPSPPRFNRSTSPVALPMVYRTNGDVGGESSTTIPGATHSSSTAMSGILRPMNAETEAAFDAAVRQLQTFTHSASGQEQRVRTLFHNRPRLILRRRPLVVVNAVLNRTAWMQPLFHLPLCCPCLPNEFYLPTKGEFDTMASGDVDSTTYGGLMPSTVHPGNTVPRSGVSASSSLYESQTRHLQATGAAARTAPYGNPSSGAEGAVPTSDVFSSPERNAGVAMTTAVNLPLSRAAAPAAVDTQGNTMHCLYRLLCVRCALAEQSLALRADHERRFLKPFVFPLCGCFDLRRPSLWKLLCLMGVLDLLSAGLPCGCGYHGIGTAIFGCRLRYAVRVRYNIFAWTALDFVLMLCSPWIGVDQQGTELHCHEAAEETVCLTWMI